MAGGIRTLTCLGGMVLFIVSAGAHADEADEVRRAVMGHEAFVERCIEERVIVTAGLLDVDLESMSDSDMNMARKSGRRICEAYYEGINVCMPDGPAKAKAVVANVIEAVSGLLNDPLTRADDYESYSRLKDTAVSESLALDDLIAGRTSYCNVE